MEASTQPSAEELAQAAQVSTAAATAIAASSSKEEAREKAHAAVTGKAAELKMDLSDESVTKIVDELVDRLSGLGAFDAPPAATPAPAPAAEAPTTPAAAAVPVPDPAALAQAPVRQSWAERHFGS